MKLILICLNLILVPLSFAWAQGAVVSGEYIVKMKAQTGVSNNSRLNKGLSVINKLGASISVKQAFWG